MKKWSASAYLWLGALVVMLLAGGFGGWAAYTEIAGATVASGQIEVDQNRQIVQHPEGGVISEILVDEGQTVVAGDILIRLDRTLLETEIAITEARLFEILARKARLIAERDGTETLLPDPLLADALENLDVREMLNGQEQLFHARRETLAQTIEQLDRRRAQTANQIEGIEAQQTALAEQLVLVDTELESQQSLLERELTQSSRVLALQRDRARLNGQIGELIASKAQAEGRITELDIEILRLSTQRREDAITELRDITSQQAELVERRLLTMERLSRLDIRAPVSGIVYGLKFNTPNAVIRPAEPVLFIIPQDRPLVIASRIAPIHVDQAYVGQPVTLRFPSFDTRTTPELFGHVVSISADAFVDEITTQSYYRAEIILDTGELEKLPEGHVLIPGMPVEAYLRTTDRTPLSYLLKPLTDYFARAFREN